MKESDVPLLDNHTINEQKIKNDANEKLNNKVDEAKNNTKKIDAGGQMELKLKK